jgi:hypothetical protein
MATIRSLNFATNTGTVEQFNKMYRVHTDDGQTPVGTFQIELVDPVDISLLVFDIVTLPSDPGIRVFGSTNGIDKVAALDLTRSGYRVNAWLPNTTIRFLQIEISPTHPDTIGGNTFTFGLTSFNAFTVDFHLYSELVMRPVVMRPGASSVRFRSNSRESPYTYCEFFKNGLCGVLNIPNGR